MPDGKLKVAMNIIRDIVNSGCSKGDPHSITLLQVLMCEEADYIDTKDINKLETWKTLFKSMKDIFTEVYSEFEKEVENHDDCI